MKKTISIIFFLLSFSVNAQNWLWARSTPDGGGGGGAGDNRASSVSADGNGNVYITGIFLSPSLTFGSFVLTNAGGGNGYAHDIFILKYDSGGNVLWAKSFGGTGDDNSYSVCTDANGDAFITGNFRSPSICFGSTTLTLTNYGESDMYIVKCDANGNILWAKSAKSSEGVAGNSVSADNNGNVFVTGGFLGTQVVFDSTSLTNVSGPGSASDLFIAKYDPNGVLLWAKSAGGANEDYGASITTDNIGNVYITGAFQSPTLIFGYDTLKNSGGSCYIGCYDAYIAKYDANGNSLWAKGIGGKDYYDWSYSISADNSGNTFITGLFASPQISFDSLLLINAHTGYNDIFIAKYDPVGKALWAKQAGGPYNDFSNSISADPQGNSFLTGWFNNSSISFDSITIYATNAHYNFTVEYDANGNALCASSGAGGDGVSADNYGNAYIGGGFNNTLYIIGADTLETTGGSNVLVAKFRCGENNSTKTNMLVDEKNISIYPNPSTGIFTFQIRNCHDSKLSVCDILGNRIFDAAIGVR